MRSEGYRRIEGVRIDEKKRVEEWEMGKHMHLIPTGRKYASGIILHSIGSENGRDFGRLQC